MIRAAKENGVKVSGEVCPHHFAMTEDEIPEGMYLYHLRERDDGDGFATLEAKVKVNHGGSVITNEPIALGEDGYIALSDENYPNFMGDTRTLAAFMGGDFPSQGLDLTM